MQILDQDAAHVLAARVEGVVDTDDVRTLYSKLNEKLDQHDHVGLMLDIVGFDDATRNAIDEDIKNELALLPNLAQFRRMAIVTDKQWVAYMCDWLSGLVPTLTIRTYAPGDKDAALTWVAETAA